MGENFRKSERPKREMLAARQDGFGELVNLGGRQQEDDVRGWLFESLQQSVEPFGSDLMGLVDDEDLVPVSVGSIASILAQFTNGIDATVRSCVDFNDVY